MIAIVMVTCNRLPLLRQTVERVLSRTSSATTRIVIWNNASTDGTRAYLDTLQDPRLDIVHHPENITLNAYRPAIARTSEPYLIELDDDIIDAPQDWDRTLLEAYQRVEPPVGYLAADIIDDGKSLASQIRYHRDVHKYRERTVNGVTLLDGPAGGWCTLVSRKVDEAAGGHKQKPGPGYFSQDSLYTAAVRKAGYELALLPSLKVFHASGPAYSNDAQVAQLKAAYFAARDRRRQRRNAVKRVLVAVPGVAAINRKLRLFHEPPPVTNHA